MLVAKLTAVLKVRSGATADMPAGLSGSTALQPQQRIDQQEASGVEQQHGDRIGDPVLLACLFDAGDPVEPDLNGPSTGDKKVRSPSNTRAM